MIRIFGRTKRYKEQIESLEETIYSQAAIIYDYEARIKDLQNQMKTLKEKADKYDYLNTRYGVEVEEL